MTLRITLAVLLAAAPAVAQPAKQSAPKPTVAPKAPPAAADDMGEFDKELNALFAQGGLTSEQAAARAAGASPTVRRRAAELEAAIAGVESAQLALVPVVSGKASYTRLSKVPPFAFRIPLPDGTISEVSSASPANSYVTEAQLVVPLSDYLLRYPKLISAARSGADAAKLNQRASEVGAGQDARIAYYEWVRAKLQVLVSQRQLLQVQRTLEQFRALAEAQRLSKADLMRVESQEAEAEQVVDQLENLAQLREEQLRLLIGAGSEPLAIGEDIRGDVAAPQASQLDALMGTAKQQRLEFKAIDAGLRAKESQRASEWANILPKLSVFGVVDYSRPNQRVFPQVDEFRYTWQAGVQATWTLGEALQAHATRRRLDAEAAELRADRENLERGTRLEVLQAQQAVLLAQHALSTSQKGLAAAEEGYRVRKELLAADRATAVELVDAETELTRARIAALDARVDLRVARAQLAHALGNDTK